MWTIGYTGQSPERLKERQQHGHWGTFDTTTLLQGGGRTLRRRLLRPALADAGARRR